MEPRRGLRHPRGQGCLVFVSIATVTGSHDFISSAEEERSSIKGCFCCMLVAVLCPVHWHTRASVHLIISTAVDQIFICESSSYKWHTEAKYRRQLRVARLWISSESSEHNLPFFWECSCRRFNLIPTKHYPHFYRQVFYGWNATKYMWSHLYILVCVSIMSYFSD